MMKTSDKIFQNKFLFIIITISCMALWGSAIPMIKKIYEYISIGKLNFASNILIAGYRLFGASIITAIYYFLFDRKKIDWKKVNYKGMIIIGLIQTFLQYAFFYIGLFNTGGIETSIIQSFNAFAIVILSRIFFKNEKITKLKLLALILGTSGVLVSSLSNKTGLNSNIFGEGSILSSTLLNALSVILVKKYIKNQNPFIINIGQLIVGSIPLILIGLKYNTTDLIFNKEVILLLIYGMFITATAYTLWYYLLKYYSSSILGIYKLFVPIFGSIFSVFFLNEQFTFNLLIGMILVLLGILILNIRIIIMKLKIQ